MTARMLLDAMERDDLPRMPLGERLVYLELCYGADRKSVIRLSQSDLAAKLGVTRQAVVKHIDSLASRQLVMRVGHGRYRIFAESWSIEKIAREYLSSLPIGAEFLVEELIRRAYGEDNDLDWNGSNDPRVDELCAFGDRFQVAGLLTVADDGSLLKARPKT